MTRNDDGPILLAGVARDIKWICRTLTRMESALNNLEERVRHLETGIAPDRRVQGLSLGAGGAVGGLVALLMKIFGGW